MTRPHPTTTKPKKPKAARSAESYWVLKQDEDFYFRDYGPIGPRGGSFGVAYRFCTQEEAMRSEAYCHPRMRWEPVEIRTRKGERSR